jgi:HAD superfamily hydrolase (TIGR01549 family)
MKTIHNSIEELDAIFWDFDGVFLNSNEIRDNGFSEVLKEYPVAEVNKLLAFHQQNGGLSRYVKFRYFFEKIRGVSITETEVQQWADRFSVIMRGILTNPTLLIQETVNYVKCNHGKIPMFIVSGSDQQELRFLCKAHGIDQYFRRIHGSPTPKKELVKMIIHEEQIDRKKCILIGDSINDYEAAINNQIKFYGYNNDKLKKVSAKYITNIDFSSI